MAPVLDVKESSTPGPIICAAAQWTDLSVTTIVHDRLVRKVLLISIALLIAACSRQPGLPAASEFRIGATREQITDRFGMPQHTQIFHKTGSAIWGPIEDFWPEVAIGSTVEVWSYRVQGGSAELYFVDNSNQVQGTGFAPEGAVFESSTGR